MKNPNFSMQWHITDKCDQRCKHCYIYEGKEKDCSKEFDLKTLKAILDNFINFCNSIKREPRLVITGGDPLLYHSIWEFLSIIKDANIKFSILGNPFHLNFDVVKRLGEMGCTSYQMSLDGLKETHDYIRKTGSFDATIDALKYFENSKINTAIMTTISKININEIPDLVDIVVKHNVNNFGFARYCPNQDEINLMVTPEEYRAFLDKMWSKYNEYKNCKTNFILKDHLWKLYLYEKGLFDPKKTSNPNDLILDGCHCGISHITTLADGTVYACRRSKTPIGHVPEDSYEDIFFGKEMEKYRMYDKFEHCSKCELKNYCRGCPSVANCQTGNFYAKDPQCWKSFLDGENDFRYRRIEKDKEMRITKLTDERLIKIDPKEEGFFDTIEQVKSLSFEINYFLCLVKEVKKINMDAFYKPIYDPADSYEGNHLVTYQSGRIPAVNHSYKWWCKTADNMPTVEGRKWKVMGYEQYIVFLVYLFNSMVKAGTDLNDAIFQLIYYSKDLGVYESKAIELTGSKEVCGFYDLANTCKFVVPRSGSDGVRVVSGAYYADSRTFTLGFSYYFDQDPGGADFAVGILVL